MTSPARRKMVRAYRFLQTWPLWFVAAAIVGLMICLVGWIAGRPTWIKFGVWFWIPLLGLLVNLVFLLAISVLVNLGILLWGLVFRHRHTAGSATKPPPHPQDR
jgi:hypothetical protein